MAYLHKYILFTEISVCCCLQSPSRIRLCDPVDCSTPGSLVLQYLPESAQIHVHGVRAAIISFSAVLFFCSQSFPTLGSFPGSWLFTSSDQNIGASASASVLPMNTQDWFPLGWTGLISLQPKGLSRVFSSTTIQKHQFLGVQLSLWSNSHIYTWLLEKPLLWLYRNINECESHSVVSHS